MKAMHNEHYPDSPSEVKMPSKLEELENKNKLSNIIKINGDLSIIQ